MKYLLTFTAGVVLAGAGVFLALRPQRPVQQPRTAEFPSHAAYTPNAPVVSVSGQKAAPAAGSTFRRPPKKQETRPFLGSPAPVARRVSMEMPPPPALGAAAAKQQSGLPALLTSTSVMPPPAPHRVTLAAGTIITVLLDEDLSSANNLSGDSFSASLDRPVVADGFVIAEHGSRIEGRIVDVRRSGRVKSSALLSLSLRRLHTSDGQSIPITTDAFTKRASRERSKDAAKIGAAASVGAIIGAIAGGGKGAAIGAAIGGGAGTGGVLATRGAPAVLPAETRIPFRLAAPVTITERLQ